MKFSLLFLVLLFICLSSSAPLGEFLRSDFGYPPLTESQKKGLAEWTEDDKQNIWELSGKFEGDIILTPNDPLNGLISQEKRWKNRTIPYVFDDQGAFSEEQKDFINRALTLYAKLTCITARPKEPSDEDYVRITAYQEGCFSEVGRQGSAQQINLQPNEPGSGCLRNGTILHEFLHALGFYHQQSASERDDFVKIVWENISPGKEHNFLKYGDNVVANFNVTYDYDSVLHYSAYGFSVNGERTIVPLDESAEIGQRIGLSEKDILKLNRMYGCDPNFKPQFNNENN